MSSMKSTRVQLRPDLQEQIQEIALKLDCTYGGIPSITALLSDIANGKIQLQRPNSHSIVGFKKKSLVIQLSMTLPGDLIGIVSLISGKISESECNILELNTKGYNILNILVELSEISKMKRLMENLYEIPVSSLKEFNKSCEFKIRGLERMNL
jgi:hypothetical protein